MTYTFEQYQDEALVTRGSHDSEDAALCNWAMGLAGEAGEFVDELKKVIFHGKPRNKEKLMSELGDVLWYVSVCCSSLGMSMGEVARANIDKLRQRHGTDDFKRHEEQTR